MEGRFSRENRDQGAFIHPFPYSTNTTLFVWMYEAGTVYAANKMVTLKKYDLGSWISFTVQFIREKRYTESVLSAECSASPVSL